MKIYENASFAPQNWWKQLTTLFHLRWSFDDNVTSMQVHPPLMDVPHIGDCVTHHLSQSPLTRAKLSYNCFSASGFFFHEKYFRIKGWWPFISYPKNCPPNWVVPIVKNCARLVWKGWCCMSDCKNRTCWSGGIYEEKLKWEYTGLGDFNR